MKIGKILFSIVGLLILLVGGAAWYVLSNINAIVRDVVETQGSQVLQTPVVMELVDIKLLDGSAELGKFSIANYEGFEQPNLLSFEAIKVDIDPTTINQEVIVLDEVTISGVALVAEQKGTTTNLQALLDKLPESEAAAETESSTGEAGSDVLLAIRKLNFVGNNLSLATEDYGTHTLDLPAITRTNLGSSANGLTPAELGTEILEPLLEEAQDKIEEGLVDLAKEKLEEKYGEKIDEEKEKLKSKLEGELGVDSEKVEEKLKGLKKLF